MKSIQLALLSFACTLTSAAQSPPAQFASRTALIIGISTYSKPEISSLPGVAADRLMAEGKVGRLSGEGDDGAQGRECAMPGAASGHNMKHLFFMFHVLHKCAGTPRVTP